MTFAQRFHDLLTGTDPRPLVSEVRPDGVHDLRRPALADLVSKARGGLVAAGVRPGDRVVLLAANSIAWVATDLALLFEGAISVPLYTRQATDELVAMMHDADPSLVICGDTVLASRVRLAWPEAPLTTLDDLLASAPRIAAPRTLRPEDIVTIVYTSGTSGAAKGVMISVANVDFMLPRTADALAELLGDEAGADLVYHYLPLCFMGSRIVLWTSIWREVELMMGVDVDRIADDLPLANPHYLLNVPVLLERVKLGAENAIASKSVVVGWLYARGRAAWARHLDGGMRGLDATWWKLADRFLFAPIRARFGPNLRFLICGSAPLSPATQSWYAMIGIPVYQVYGLTETTAIVTMDRPGLAVAGRVGYAIDGVQTALGAEDELLVRGPHVFAGYWRNIDATAAVLRDGWFHTGDQATVDEHGNHAIVGRVKNLLVPSSGHNVAPEPLELAIAAGAPGVEQVVVVGHGRPYLTAVVTGAASTSAVQAAVDTVNATLPHYKRIRRFWQRAEPLTDAEGLLTANGKLKRAAIEHAFADAIEAMYA
ncbi:MAG: AMP-binding protein [Alphaproteobacteria bacterium]|nr:AMP-binding protein [Alphaproteobacteria bacterium]